MIKELLIEKQQNRVHLIESGCIYIYSEAHREMCKENMVHTFFYIFFSNLFSFVCCGQYLPRHE